MTDVATPKRHRQGQGVRHRSGATTEPRRALTPDEVLRMLTPLDGGAHTEDPERLIQGATLKCPACGERQDILAFWPLELVERFQSQLAVALRCRLCLHIFALNSGGGDDAADV
jgi:hypothetical protein